MSDLLTFAVFCLSKIVERFIHIKSSTPPCNPAVMVSAFDLKPSVPQHTRNFWPAFLDSSHTNTISFFILDYKSLIITW